MTAFIAQPCPLPPRTLPITASANRKGVRFAVRAGTEVLEVWVPAAELRGLLEMHEQVAEAEPTTTVRIAE